MRKNLTPAQSADFTAERLVSHYRDDIIEASVEAAVADLEAAIDERNYIIDMFYNDLFGRYADAPEDDRRTAETPPSKLPLEAFDVPVE